MTNAEDPVVDFYEHGSEIVLSLTLNVGRPAEFQFPFKSVGLEAKLSFTQMEIDYLKAEVKQLQMQTQTS